MKYDTTSREDRSKLYAWAAEYADNCFAQPHLTLLGQSVKTRGFCYLFKLAGVYVYGESHEQSLLHFAYHLPELYYIMPKEWPGMHMFSTDEEGWTTRIDLLIKAKKLADGNTL